MLPDRRVVAKAVARTKACAVVTMDVVSEDAFAA